MAKCILYFDTRNVKADRFPLKIMISHKRIRKPVITPFKLSPQEWNAENEAIQPPFKNIGRANARLNRMKAIVGETIIKLEPYLKQLSAQQIADAAKQKIDEEFSGLVKEDLPAISDLITPKGQVDNSCFFEFTENLIQEYYAADRGGSAMAFGELLKSLRKYWGKKRLPFSQITIQFLEGYDRWYLNRLNNRGEKNTVNGLGVRMRDIRRIFNQAKKDKNLPTVTKDIYPFGEDGYSIRVEETTHRNIEAHEIAKLFQLELEPETPLWHHQNLIKFYFDTWGMNFIDLAYLRKYHVKKGVLTYKRRKTRNARASKKFEIQLSPLALKIFNYYAHGKNSTELVFPIMDKYEHLLKSLNSDDKQKKEGEEEEEQKPNIDELKLFETILRSRRKNHNRRLRTLAKKAGIDQRVTTYVSRHSFFTIANENDVTMSEIKDMAGHRHYGTTEKYVAKLSNKKLNSSGGKVRRIVQNATHNPEADILDSQVRVLTSRETYPVRVFFENHMAQNPALDRTQTAPLVIALLQCTDCTNGAVAQQYAEAYVTVALSEQQVS